jgi:PilZ domain
MSVSTGRREKRTPMEVPVVLSHPNKNPHKERTLTENVSPRGLRAVTKRTWQPGTRLLVTFDREGIQGPAQVVYCQRLANDRFAVGLALPAQMQQGSD